MEFDVAPTNKRATNLKYWNDVDNWKIIEKNVDDGHPEQAKFNYLWKRYPYVFGNDVDNGKIITENNIDNEHPEQTKFNDLYFPFHSLWKRYPYVFGIEPDNDLNFHNSPTKKMSNSKNYIPPQLRKYFNGFIQTV